MSPANTDLRVAPWPIEISIGRPSCTFAPSIHSTSSSQTACPMNRDVGLANEKLTSSLDVPVRNVGVPERFLDHGKRAEVLAECGLTAQDVSRSIVEAIAGATPEATPVREAGSVLP